MVMVVNKVMKVRLNFNIMFIGLIVLLWLVVGWKVGVKKRKWVY